MSLVFTKDGVIRNKANLEKENTDMAKKAEKAEQEQQAGDQPIQGGPVGEIETEPVPVQMKTVDLDGTKVQIPKNAHIVGWTKHPDKKIVRALVEDPKTNWKQEFPL